MGGGGYSLRSRSVRSESLGYKTKSVEQIFVQHEVHSLMDPNGVMLRESRDSDEHPISVPIILGLDVTGSMGRIPHDLVKDGLPTIMGTIIEAGVEHPQLLFVAIGDHLYDRTPLQIGQFESSDELLDKWLTSVWLEGGGGGNGGESYALAYYFAGFHTKHDAIEKRSMKGTLITIGDEPCHRTLSASDLDRIMGKGEYRDYSAAELVSKASENYNVYHLHIAETPTGANPSVIAGWKELLGDNLIVVKDFREIPKIVADLVLKNSKRVIANSTVSSKPQTAETSENEPEHNPVL
jgi:hypothetical protein